MNKNATADKDKDVIANKDKNVTAYKDKDVTADRNKINMLLLMIKMPLLMMVIPTRLNESFCASPPCRRSPPTGTWRPS